MEKLISLLFLARDIDTFPATEFRIIEIVIKTEA